MYHQYIKVCTMLCFASLFPIDTFADIEACQTKAVMAFEVESWIHSNDTLVQISISASSTAQKTDGIINDIQKKLQAISNQANWRIINMARQESKAGLVNISAQAVARLKNNQLSFFQEKLKTLNQPGIRFEIEDMDTRAQLDTIQNAKADLRRRMYQIIRSGEKELNASLAEGHTAYQLYELNFNTNDDNQHPVTFSAAQIRANPTSKQNSSNQTAEKLQMKAEVTYISYRKSCLEIDK